MRAGKQVISEKPVTLNAAELEEIIAVSKETGRLFSIHQNRRWDKDYRIIKRIYDEKLLGTPYFIESKVQGSRQAMHGWRGHKQNGGGMLLDWGVQFLHIRKSTNLRRLVTGLLCGYGMMDLELWALQTAISKAAALVCA